MRHVRGHGSSLGGRDARPTEERERAPNTLLNGLIAGTIAFLPIAAAVAVLLFFVPVASGPGAGPQFAIWAVVLLVLLVVAVYTV